MGVSSGILFVTAKSKRDTAMGIGQSHIHLTGFIQRSYSFLFLSGISA
jgi:hypothetical protein